MFNSLAGEIEIKSSIQLGGTEMKKKHKPIDDHAIFLLLLSKSQCKWTTQNQKLYGAFVYAFFRCVYWQKSYTWCFLTTIYTLYMMNIPASLQRSISA